MGIARRSGRPQLPNIFDPLPPRFGLLGRTAWLAGWRLPQRGVHIVLAACALGQQAARAGARRQQLHAPPRATRELDLLLIDDFALAPNGAHERTDLLELLNDRMGSRSIITTSQLPLAARHEGFGEPTLAEAVLDRIVHGAHMIGKTLDLPTERSLPSGLALLQTATTSTENKITPSKAS